jgi:transposase
MVKMVNDIIERIDIEPLIKQDKGGGKSTYDPKMLVKKIVYAYIQ